MLSNSTARWLQRRGIHYGWLVAAITFLTMLTMSAALGLPGAMLQPLSREFGWSTEQISSSLALRFALFGLLGQTNLNAMNGLKNWVSALLTAIAVAIYAAGGVVQWPQALMMMAAATAGGWGGARVARRIPAPWLRAGIVITGLVMAGLFFWRQ